MPRVTLVLGPLLRYAGTESATFWVETSEPCEVEILGRRTRTFTVEGHHYALLLVDDLEPATVTPYEVRLDGELVWPPDDGRPRAVVRTRNGERRVRLGLRLVPRRRARAGIARGTVARRARPRGSRRPLGVLEGAPDAARRNGPTRCCCSATRSTPTRSRRRRSPSSAARRDTTRAARRAGRRLRGVHAPLPRVLVRPGHPLAALDRAERDDLRRPRRARRLEHLLELGRGDAREAVVGRAHHGRVHGVLDLPAHRQPLAARARRGGDAASSSSTTTTPGRASARPPAGATASRPRAAGPTTATSADSRLLVVDSRAARVLADGRRDMVDDGGVGLDRRHTRGRRSTTS